MKIILITLALVTGIARADDAPPHALIVHVPPIESPMGAPIELAAMIDAPYAEALAVRWRAIGEPAWHDTRFERSSAGGWYATLPPAMPPGVEYYIHGTDPNGVDVDHFASEQAPHVVVVEPSLADRLETLDRHREAGRTDEVAFDVVAHNFGNRYDLPDEFVRAELVYTHRLLRLLNEVGFGFGTITGQTPAMAAPDADVLSRGMRYGFGQVRLRLDPSVFFDARAGLGVSDEGFEQLVRGEVTFGKPWRSNVSVGGEYLGSLGPSAWVRLQWDTAPPLLMGASIVRTDLPGAVVSALGLYVAYDVAYRIANRVAVKAQVSYGSRDGAANFGGGLGTAVDF